MHKVVRIIGLTRFIRRDVPWQERLAYFRIDKFCHKFCRWLQEFVLLQWSHLVDHFSHLLARKRRHRTLRRAQNPSAARPRRRIAPVRTLIILPETQVHAQVRIPRPRARIHQWAICQVSRTSRIINAPALFTASSINYIRLRRTFIRRIAGSLWATYHYRHWPEHRVHRRSPQVRREAQARWRSPRVINLVVPILRNRTVQVWKRKNGTII